MKKPSLGTIANLALIVAAAFAVWNSVRPRPMAGAPPAMGELESWEDEIAAGIQVGPADAPIEIIELMDFQCPFCRMWAARLDSLRVEHPGAVRVSFHHWPLSNHQHALPAAVASECALRQGRFEPFARALFDGQNLLGTQPWRTYAEEAGIGDLDAFEACVALSADSFPRIQHGIDMAERLNASGTPTVWVNGEVRRPPPTLEELRELAGGGR